MQPVTTRRAPAISVRYALGLILLTAALSLALYFPTLRYSWAFDDIEYMNVSAEFLAGKLSLLSALAIPHDEHVVPLFRLLFLTYMKLFGLNAVLWRVLSVLVHAASAVFVALLAWRYSGKERAGVAAAIVYAASCGFSSMFVWFPSGAAVPLSFAALTGASALLAWRDHLRVRRIIAGIAVVAALLAWRSFAPMAFLPAIIDEIERRLEGARRPIGAFSLFCLAAIASVVLGGMPLITVHVESNTLHGLPRSLFLVLVAPFRFFFPSLPIIASDTGRSTALLGSALGVTVGAVIIALLAVLWRRGVPRLARVATLCAIPPVGAISLIGLFRSQMTYLETYDADRYFYPLLIPIALLAGAVAASISLAGCSRGTRIAFALALVAVGTGEIAIHQRAMLRWIPVGAYVAHGHRFATLDRLVRRLESAGPMEIPDDRIWFPGMYQRIETAVLTNILSDGHRLHIGSTHIDPGRLNPLLDAWAIEQGEAVPFVRVIDGNLVNTRLPTIVDFSKAPCDDLVLGFLEWEKPFRWMGARSNLTAMVATSDLELRLAAPLSDLRRRYPAWTSMPVHVTLVDGESGYTADLGVINITEDGVHDYRLPVTSLTSHAGIGGFATIVLQCDHVWKPSEIYGTADRRERSVQVFSAGTRFSS
jgi:hypothetical protein